MKEVFVTELDCMVIVTEVGGLHFVTEIDWIDFVTKVGRLVFVTEFGLTINVMKDGSTIFDMEADEMHAAFVHSSTEGAVGVTSYHKRQKSLKVKFLSFEESCIHKFSIIAYPFNKTIWN